MDGRKKNSLETKFPNLKEVLQQEYLMNNKSDREIATLLCVTPPIIQRYRIKYGIKSRPSFVQINKDRQSIQLTEHEIEVLDGLLLGDGSLVPRKNKDGQYISARYGHSSKHSLDSIPKQFNSIGFSQQKYRKTTYVCKDGSPYYAWDLQSLYYPILLQQRYRWYPGIYEIKRIPDDVRITPTSCYWWYIGDGSLPHRKDPKRPTTDEIQISTNAFVNDIINLEDFRNKLTNIIGIDYIGIDNGGRLHIYGHRNIQIFLSFIGPCRNPEYVYKWDLIEN